MKGCEMQCGNRFDYLLIWRLPRSFVSEQETLHACVHIKHTSRNAALRTGGVILKPHKFMQIAALL